MDLQSARSLIAARSLNLDQLRAKDPRAAASVDTILAGARGTRVVAAGNDAPLEAEPAIAAAISLARVVDLTAIAGITGAAADAVAKVALATTDLDDDTVTQLVTAKQLTEAQARALGFTAAIYELVDQDTQTATAIRAIGNSTRDLAALSAADWTQRYESGALAVPAGSTAAAAGRQLADRFALLHPGPAFFGRLPTIDATAAGRLTSGDPRAAELTRVYPGLGIAELIADGSAAATRGTTIARRVALVHTAATALGDRGLWEIDLSAVGDDIARLLPGDTSASEKQMVRATLAAHQRMVVVARDVDTARTMLGAGFTSALAIGAQPYAAFAEAAGIEDTTARRVWHDARSSLSATTNAVADTIDTMQGGFAKLWPSNFPPSWKAYLAQLPGFAQLFGSVSYCDCEECQSILGPAAYYVDLMKYIDEYIRGPSFKQHPNHPLDLRVRRLDLWTLELSCDNTNDIVALLDLVNEVLENYIALQAQYQGKLADRTAVEALVYATVLAGHIDSFRQPFVLPLARATAYLVALGHSRSEIATAAGAGDSVWTGAELAIGAVERQQITQPVTTLAALSHLYGVAFAGSNTAVAPVDALALVDATGLDRGQLGQLVATAVVGQGSTKPAIHAAKSSAQSVQNDVERVTGLSTAALDRMYRFTRLLRRTGWSIADLDLVARTLGDLDLGPATLDAIARVHGIAARYTLAVPETCALIGALPDALLDSLFNDPAFVATQGAYPLASQAFFDPAFQSTAPSADPNLPRLLAGLGVGLDELTALARHLAPNLARTNAPDFNPDDPDPTQRYFVLSAPNLTLLYRHARLARMLDLAVDDLFQLLGLLQHDRVAGLADLHALIDLADWCTTAPYALDDLALATGGTPRDPSRFPDPAALAASVVASAGAALVFTDTVFAVALATTEQASRDLIAANPAVIEAASNGAWRLASGVDLAAAAISVPPSALVPTPPSGTRLVTEAEVRAALAPYAASGVLVRRLGNALGVTSEKVVALATLGGQTLPDDALVHAIRGDGPVAPLIALISALRPLAVVFAAGVWDPAALGLVMTSPQLFGTPPLPAPGPIVALDQLRALSVYARIAQRTPAIDPADLRAVLSGFAAGSFPASVDVATSRILAVPLGLLVGLRGRLALPGVAAPALEMLERAARLAIAIGINGDAFGGLLSDDYPTLSLAADALYAALGARTADPDAREIQLDTAEQPIREAKRDALTDYLLRSVTPRHWRSLDELYDYFLIDVSAGGCEETSRVVAATMTAQLYVYRTMMNLEQTPADAPVPLTVAMTDPEAITEWEWRKNYRVWQANREVFLWPENYLVPDLRDDKSPLFEELEQNLLQTDITDQNVLDAYAAYLAGLEELSKLTIAGAYHDTPGSGDVKDVLHLFGVSAEDPPTFYYRTCQNLREHARHRATPEVWSPWQKLTIPIAGRTVSPIVHEGRLYVFWTALASRSKNQIVNGESDFVGYTHTLTMKYSTLRSDATWSAPQELRLPDDRGGFDFSIAEHRYFGPGRGVIADKLDNARHPRLDPSRRHADPIDDYTLSGTSWEGVWADSWSGKLTARYRNFHEPGDIHLFERTVTTPDVWSQNGRRFVHEPTPKVRPPLLSVTAQDILYTGTPQGWPTSTTAYPNIVIDPERLDRFVVEDEHDAAFYSGGLHKHKLATVPGGRLLLAVPGSVEDAVIQVGADILYMQGSAHDDGHYILRRFGSTVITKIAKRLFERGVDNVLDIAHQLDLAEADAPLSLLGNRVVDHSGHGKLDYTGPYGVYYRELYFHIPFLIADALNARGSFDSAQTWYRYLFDPTAVEKIHTTGVPASDVAHRLLDRVWRYREFRKRDVPSLRAILTDQNALALYKSDPFNPWAIARTRISAFQKAIVMRYVGNLLDWADSLFTQFTLETVNEALMLYVLAEEILGPRPAELGDCGAGIEPMTYEHIGPLVDGDSEVLVELESWLLGTWLAETVSPIAQATYAVDRSALAHAIGVPAAAATVTDMFRGPTWTAVRTQSWSPALASAKTVDKHGTGGRALAAVDRTAFATFAGRFGWATVRQLTPVFCVPANSQLLAYWDRVADRLYKIRHCLDITGQHATLALFAPPIDPMQLVAMKAAGLGLDDVLGVSNGNLPPYRFLYLIERAKAFAASLTSFGSALLATLEKKDGESLNRLRLTQQMNLTQLTTHIRQQEIATASELLESTSQQLTSAQYRSDWYGKQLADGRNFWEQGEEAIRDTLATAYIISGVYEGVKSALALVPQIGSPFAMKFGGVELAGMMKGLADQVINAQRGLETVATAMAMEGNLARRDDTWTHQKALADRDIKIQQRQVNAAQIRLDIANRAMDIHQKTLDQLQQLIDYGDEKFTSLGLYTWLAAQLQKLYRAAYQNALALAKLAELAYRFERGDDTLPGLSLSYWDPTHAGLLAGEQLLIDLQGLERRFIETNYRQLEVDQTFALSQIDPQALVVLRETGECTFTLGEVFFDLGYPGHYKRRIKAVRLTIPCITGPYVNIGATLALQRSWVRSDPGPGKPLVEVPPTRTVSIASSTAQNDAGVFELTFRDERYMPFEGLGAISQWNLSLPKSFRPFDYETITDVVVAVSYQAQSDGALRAYAETQNAALEGTIVNHFTNVSAKRVFSLRQDFSSAFTRLVRSPAGTQVNLELSDRNLPLWCAGRALKVKRGVLLLRTAGGLVPSGLVLAVDGMAVENFAADPTLGNLAGRDLPGSFTAALRGPHALTITATGSLAPSAPKPGDVAAIDVERLLDVLLYVEYRLG